MSRSCGTAALGCALQGRGSGPPLPVSTFMKSKKTVQKTSRRRENKRLLALINAAYADGLDDDEKKLLRAMWENHRRMVEGEW